MKKQKLRWQKGGDDGQRDKIIGGNVENIDLKIEVGGGIVKESIYSLAIFTNLTDLRVRKCKLEYIQKTSEILLDWCILIWPRMTSDGFRQVSLI